jgi:hypothetical protein
LIEGLIRSNTHSIPVTVMYAEINDRLVRALMSEDARANL